MSESHAKIAMPTDASVLVIDDEEIMREILQTLLEREGYRVSTVGSGEEGVSLARSNQFDVAIVDVMLPGIDGIETLEQLRRFDEDLPIILITAFASLESAVAAMMRTSTLIVLVPPKRMNSRS